MKITTVKAFANSDSEGAAEEIEAVFQGVLSRTLEDQGFTPFLDPSLMPEWEDKNATALKGLKDDFDSLSPPALFPPTSCDAFLKPSDGLLKVSFVNDLEKLAQRNEFDAVLLSRASGVAIDTSSKMAKFRVLKTDTSLHFSLAVVDGRSGQILQYCNSTAEGDYVGAPAFSLSGPLQKCLQHLHRGSPQEHH